VIIIEQLVQTVITIITET